MKGINYLWIFVAFIFAMTLQTCRKPLDGECESFRAKIILEGTDRLTVMVSNGIGTLSYKWSNGTGDLSSIVVSESGHYCVTVTDHLNTCTANACFDFKKSNEGDCGSFSAVMDDENNLYDIVTIGSQCWMKSNVNIEAGFPKITDPVEWGSFTKLAWCYYENDVNNGPKYQKLYNWYAVKSGKLCPNGWHLPTLAEWETLFKFLKTDSLAAVSMRKADPLWLGNVNATNSSGFSALPGGRRQAGGSFIYEGTEADFWTADESTLAGSSIGITIKSTYDGIVKIDWGKNHGFSCRCLKN